MSSDKFKFILIGLVFILWAPLSQKADSYPQSNEPPVKSDANPSSSKKDWKYIFTHFTVIAPGRISRYDRIIKKYSWRYGFDWRLIAAQIYAESRFDPGVRSYVGAVGLMQIMPGTAKHLGTHPKLLLKPEINIALGVLYDRRLYNIWKEEKGKDRLAFTFASYNAGHNRVLRAQKKARLPDKWKSIKRHLPGQTRHYVFKIFKAYETYKKIVF
ncbi:soluble lytic murein transglycosylase precursor [bacterium BMS3Abin05]|nr:soluble lytic murein transglycosylase precursor [bacterium BMS3Abin05]GBE26659.1 soluble lytic murein transglycosylase precursor [bacterium BMS3Bbin03]HDL78135.1 lytic transglycosylase domain-containing protein [Bacteroidota bacterium]HDZ12757.1 lytic transglycosylase domain-containing protein [Bacteroidota bacterium]